jgi:hypothetical protein
MRFTTKLLAASAAVVLVTGTMTPRAQAAPLPTAAILVSAPVVQLTATAAVVAPVQDAKIEVTTNDRSSRGAWYTQPVWIAIGIIALVLLIALIAMAGRGRDTTVVK